MLGKLESPLAELAREADEFKDVLRVPMKSRADLAPDAADQIVDLADTPIVVDAFPGNPYPYFAPDECP